MTGHDLKRIRQQLGLTQAQFAAKVGYADATAVSRAERENRRIHPLLERQVRLATTQVLNATPAMADIISGHIPCPREPSPGERWLKWASQTCGLKQAIRYLGATGSPKLIGLPDLPARSDNPEAVEAGRLALSESGGAVKIADHVIVLNSDGTRAAIIPAS